MYNISYCNPIEYAYDGLIRDLGLFRIPEAICDAGAFKFDKNVAISTIFDISMGFY